MWFLVLLTHCFIYFIFNVLCTLGPRRQKNIEDQELHREKREKDQEVGPFLLNMVLGNQKVHQERRKKGKEAIHFHQSMACGDQINSRKRHGIYTVFYWHAYVYLSFRGVQEELERLIAYKYMY